MFGIVGFVGALEDEAQWDCKKDCKTSGQPIRPLINKTSGWPRRALIDRKWTERKGSWWRAMESEENGWG